jgi:hypothetical protein
MVFSRWVDIKGRSDALFDVGRMFGDGLAIAEGHRRQDEIPEQTLWAIAARLRRFLLEDLG